MRRNVRLLAATAAVAACFAGASAGTASAALPPLPLSVSCTPFGCVAQGQLGSLRGFTILTPHGGGGVICNGFRCVGGRLEFFPRFIGAGVFQSVIGFGFADLVLTPRAVFAGAGQLPYAVELAANNGAIGVVLFKPGHPVCVGVSLTRIFATSC